MQDYMRLLGLKCRDRVTGAVGIVESVCFDLYGCVQVVLKPQIGKDGEVKDARWYDHKRVEVLDGIPVMERPSFATPGRENGPAEKTDLRG